MKEIRLCDNAEIELTSNLCIKNNCIYYYKYTSNGKEWQGFIYYRKIIFKK